MDGTLKIPSVTGIDVELRIAGPGGRSYAFVIDWHIRVLVALAWMIVAGVVYFGSVSTIPSLEPSQGDFAILVMLPAAGLYLLYHPVLEVLMRGRTPGKRIAGVRIVTRDGGVPGIGPLLVRNLFRLVDSLPFFYLVGLAAPLLTKQYVRIGAIAAGTLLVYDDAEAGTFDDAPSSRGIERLGLVRNLFRPFDSLPFCYLVGLAATLLTKRYVRIGDIAAGTLLVYDDAEAGTFDDAPSSRGIERLGLERAELVRDLLARWPELHV